MTANSKQQHNITINTIKVPAIFNGEIPGAKKFAAESQSPIMINFAECTFITVDGLEWLEEFVISVEVTGKHCRFENMIPSIYKVFKVARIDCLLRSCGAPAIPEGAVC
ncbi:MAG: hypothetical protein IPG59_10330 [Candidatus Melainabacteria bacterium]|nr:MAG: hypothetical protein IPG59_10330 [Candidatus Melainabacteria bacterium]